MFLIAVVPTISFAQRDWEAIEIKTTNIKENISYLEGSGGNIGVLHGEDGIMIVDDQFAELSEKIKAALSALSDSDLKFIVNTHYHGDHVGGNENLSKDGATIVAHQMVRERLGESFYNAIMDREVEAKPSTYWPTITFTEEIKFYLNGEEVQVIHVPNAHTDGDALIYFKTSNVLHGGDAFVRYGYPYIDVAAGGSINGLIAAQEKILEVADEETIIIPGHGGLSSIEDVKELKQMLEGTRNIIKDLKAEGKTLDECLTAQPFSEYHEKWSGSFITSDLFVRLVYESLP